jgi:uncharacterized membrane protein YphA (DoxX/SURF4 family)
MNNEIASHAETPPGKSFARHIPTLIRLLLGLMFLVFGLNGFLNFMPPPKDMPQDIMTVSEALVKGGYMTVVSATEVLVAVLLLSGLFVPLALVLLAPIVVGIITFHVALAPQTIAPGIVVLVMELYLAWAYRSAFRPILAARVTPG